MRVGGKTSISDDEVPNYSIPEINVRRIPLDLDNSRSNGVSRKVKWYTGWS